MPIALNYDAAPCARQRDTKYNKTQSVQQTGRSKNHDGAVRSAARESKYETEG